MLGRKMISQIEVLDASQDPDILVTKGLDSVFGYDFTGSTDILLAHSNAVRIGMPEIGCVAAFDLKKGRVSPSSTKKNTRL